MSGAVFFGHRPKDSDREVVPPISSGQLASVLAVIGCVVLYVLTIRNSNLDDSLYLNFIVGMMQHPEWPLFRFDSMFGIADLPIINTAYAVDTLQPLQAVIASWMSLSPIWLRQILFAPLFAISSIVFVTALCRRLLPAHWLCVLVSYVALTLIWSEGFRSIGSFHFNYLSTEKNILVAVLVPALAYNAIAWSRNGKLTDLIFLAICNIAAVGLTPNAIYIAPLTTGLVLLADSSLNYSGMKRLFTGGLTTVYPAACGLILKLTTSVGASEVLESESMESSLRTSLGWDYRYWLFWSVMVGGWAALPDRRNSRLFAFWLIGFLFIIANPFLNEFWGAHVTGNLNWRLVWALPCILLFSTVLHVLAGAACRSALCAWVPSLLLIAWLVISPSKALVQLWTNLGQVSIKVPEPEYQIASMLQGRLSPVNHVLAPENIAAYIPTFQNHPYPLVPRPLYLFHFRNIIPPTELLRRTSLYVLVSPTELEDNGAVSKLISFLVETGLILDKHELIPLGASFFAEAVKNHELAAVALKSASANSEYVTKLLSSAGFQRKQQGGYDFWLSEALDGFGR